MNGRCHKTGFQIQTNCAKLQILACFSDTPLRIWRTGKDRLICKVWFGAEPPPLRLQQKTTSRFRGTDSKRIQTMWSGDNQSWCRWDADLGDYVVAPELNSES